MTIARDKNKRPVTAKALYRAKDGRLYVANPQFIYPEMAPEWKDDEIVALAWTSPVPETYAPPRDSKGRPCCKGDRCRSSSGVEFIVRSDAGSDLTDDGGTHYRASFCTILRFAGETEDIDGGEALPDGWRKTEHRDYEHTSGAIVCETAAGQWSYFRHGSDRSDGFVSSRSEAIRLALNLPVASPPVRTSEPRLVYADGHELRQGDAVEHTHTGTEYLVHAINDDGTFVPALGDYVYPLKSDAGNFRLVRRASVPADLPAPAIIPATEQRRRVEQYAAPAFPVDPFTVAGPFLDMYLDAVGTRRLDGDTDEEARGQLLRTLWPRGPKQVVAILEAAALEHRRSFEYGEHWPHTVNGKPSCTAKALRLGLARVVAWALSGEREECCADDDGRTLREGQRKGGAK